MEIMKVSEADCDVQASDGLSQVVRKILTIRNQVLGCGARPQTVSSCLGVSEQYCNIYKKTKTSFVNF